MTVGGQTPPFPGVRELPQQVEIAQVVDKSYLGLPGQLDDFVLEDGNSLAEEFRRQVHFLNNFPGFKTNLAERGSALKPGSFV